MLFDTWVLRFSSLGFSFNAVVGSWLKICMNYKIEKASSDAKESQKLFMKKAAACAALDFVVPGAVLAVGSGSTVSLFVELLGERLRKEDPSWLMGVVPASEETKRALLRESIPSLDLNHVIYERHPIPVYVDGADEIDPLFRMIKGGGGALTREKILADVADKFVCIADVSKAVPALGTFPLPLEVIPAARELICYRLNSLGGEAKVREGFITDNSQIIIDVKGLDFSDPESLEKELGSWPGVVSVGLFALRGADVLLMASSDRVDTRESTMRSGFSEETTYRHISTRSSFASLAKKSRGVTL